jgi:curli biogenesis system outer membrane secretion channel CsgG
MLLRIHVRTLGLLAILGAAPAAAAADGPTIRPTLAIVDFETTPAGSVLPPPQLGSTLADLLMDQLVRSDKYRVLDGRWLATDDTWRRPGVPDAHRRSAFERLREAAEAHGVDYLVMGSVTRFSTENRQRTVGGAAFVLPLLAGIRRAKTELALDVMIRVVDVRSGEVVTTAMSHSKAGRKQYGVGGLGPVRAGGAGLVSNKSTGFRDSLLAESAEAAVVNASQAIVNAAPRLTRATAERACR